MRSAKRLYQLQNKSLHKAFSFNGLPYQNNKEIWLERIYDETKRKVTGLSELNLGERWSFLNSLMKDYPEDYKQPFNPYIPNKYRNWKKSDEDVKDIAADRPIKVPGHKKALVDKIKAILTDLELPWSYADGISKHMFKIDFVEHCDEDQIHAVLKALIIHQNRQGRKF